MRKVLNVGAYSRLRLKEEREKKNRTTLFTLLIPKLNHVTSLMNGVRS